MKKVLLLAAIFGVLCSPSQAKTWWNYEASCTVTDVQPTPALPFETAGYTIRIAFDARNPTKINNLQISPNADQTDFVDVLSREYSKVKYWKDGKNIIWTGCMSSEHFGQLAWQFKRVSGSSGLKVQAAIAC